MRMLRGCKRNPHSTVAKRMPRIPSAPSFPVLLRHRLTATKCSSRAGLSWHPRRDLDPSRITENRGFQVKQMNLDIKIECLREPNFALRRGRTGVEPRRVMAKAGAADSTAPKEICIGLVGPSGEVELARRWLPRLNNVATAREKNAPRYRDWPGAQKAFGTTFFVEDRFVRPLDQDRLTLALNRTSDSGSLRRYTAFCIIVCLPDEAADSRARRESAYVRQDWPYDR
jgi:hypothetical protein